MLICFGRNIAGIGRILPRYIADKVGNFNVSLCAACLSTTLVLALWLTRYSNAATMAFASLFGFSSGT